MPLRTWALLALVLTLPLATASAQGRGRGRTHRAAAAQAAPAQAAIPGGTPVEIRLVTPLHSGEANSGDTFEATIMSPVFVDGRTVLNRGARAAGRVINAVSSGRLKRPASLTLQLTSPVQSEPVTIDGQSHAGRNVGLIGGGTAAGALLGALAGGGKGAAIGAVAGAGAGTATAYFTGKKELALPAETPIRFVTAGTSPAAAYAAAREREASPSGPQAGDSYPSSRYGRTPVTVFSNADRSLISDYLQANRANLPPGLAKRDRLPPGLEKQLQRNGTLPPGLQKRVQPFPQDLSRRLPPIPAGYSRVFLGSRALLIDQANRILDSFLAE